jgi:uncharacterized protein (TIGR02421 family)
VDPVREAFFAHGGREQPPVDRDYYLQRALGYDAPALREHIRDIERDVRARLGEDDEAAGLMLRMCREYALVLAMLEARGTSEFARLSCELFGSSGDAVYDGGPSLADVAGELDRSLLAIHDSMFFEPEQPDISTDRAVELLQGRLDELFSEPDTRVRVVVSDGIVADAAAGSDYIKLRKDALFTERDLRVLEVHEGWVHVGTTLNGRAQPTCTFLSKGTPSTTVTQEGLALFTEIVTASSHPARLRRVVDRIRGIAMAENGATFRDVYECFVDEGRSRDDAYASCARIFRGSIPDGRPFTKDLSYSRGFVQVYNFIRLAARRGLLDRIALLFCGKVAMEDIGKIADLVASGIVSPPRHVPPFIKDLNALTAFMAFSVFVGNIDTAPLERSLEEALS